MDGIQIGKIYYRTFLLTGASQYIIPIGVDVNTFGDPYVKATRLNGGFDKMIPLSLFKKVWTLLDENDPLWKNL